jgi:hypothetical protein
MDLLREISDALNPEVVRRTSDFLGEHDRNAWTAIEQIIPTVTAAAVHLVSTLGGAQQFELLIERGRHEGKLLNEMSNLLSNRISAFSLLSFGERVIEKILGDKAALAAEAIAEESGIARDSAIELLNLTALVLIEILGRERASARFTPADIPQLLLAQRKNVARALPAEVGRYIDLYENPSFDGSPVTLGDRLNLLMLKLQRLFS